MEGEVGRTGRHSVGVQWGWDVDVFTRICPFPTPSVSVVPPGDESSQDWGHGVVFGATTFETTRDPVDISSGGSRVLPPSRSGRLKTHSSWGQIKVDGTLPFVLPRVHRGRGKSGLGPYDVHTGGTLSLTLCDMGPNRHPFSDLWKNLSETTEPHWFPSFSNEGLGC